MRIRLTKTVLGPLRAVGYFFYCVWRAIEDVLIIYPAEIIMRVWYALDSRVYFQSLRIKNAVDGEIDKKSDSFVVFVLYAKSPLPQFTNNAIDAIARSYHNLIIVSNAALTPLAKAELSEKCHKLIEWKNVGRDFGGYKDGVNYILEHYQAL